MQFNDTRYGMPWPRQSILAPSILQQRKVQSQVLNLWGKRTRLPESKTSQQHESETNRDPREPMKAHEITPEMRIIQQQKQEIRELRQIIHELQHDVNKQKSLINKLKNKENNQ